MRAALLERPRAPLVLVRRAAPIAGAGEVAIEVAACGVCRTDLHLLDGDLAPPRLPLVPGHQIVGRVVARGEGARRFEMGERVGVPWLGGACGHCRYCVGGRENLCGEARFTGFDRDGGFAERAVADERFCLRLPEADSDLETAPLLCAGLIGYRALRLAGSAERLGLFGFGAAAHLVAQVARWQGRRLFAVTRPDDAEAQRFALELGAEWAGAAGDLEPGSLDAALIFAPAGELVPAALRAVARGGVVVCAGIHMSDIPSFPYELLWGERALRSVANLTVKDGEEFLALAPRVPIRSTLEVFALDEVNEALARLRSGKLRGAAVLDIGREREG